MGKFQEEAKRLREANAAYIEDTSRTIVQKVKEKLGGVSGKDYILYASTNIVIVYVNSQGALFGSHEANEKAKQTLLDEKGSEWYAITIETSGLMSARITLHIRPTP